MWAAALKKSWLKEARMYDAWFAFAEGSLRGVRRMLREVVTFRLAEKRMPRKVLSVFEVLESREVPTTTAARWPEATSRPADSRPGSGGTAEAKADNLLTRRDQPSCTVGASLPEAQDSEGLPK